MTKLIYIFLTSIELLVNYSVVFPLHPSLPLLYAWVKALKSFLEQFINVNRVTAINLFKVPIVTAQSTSILLCLTPNAS